MLAKARDELLGDEVMAMDGRFGVVEDFYFDRDCWQFCYLLIARGTMRALVSMAGVEAASPTRGFVSLAMTRAELAAGAWPMDTAVPWLDEIRVCSARHVLGWRVEAEDGPAGQVVDLLVDCATWSIDYVVVDIADAFGPRQVLLPLDWADPLDPLEGAVRMRRTCAQVRSAPQLNGASLLPAARVRG